MKPIIAIVGPTGIGKTALSLRLAEEFPIEIINADSRQVYRYMDIGTAKPSPEARSKVHHHLLDMVDPDGEFSLALFLATARDAIAKAHGRGRIPVLVGGTGQYIWGLLEGWNTPSVPPDPMLRRSLEERAQKYGKATLFEDLRKVDPEAASTIDPHNVRRLVRALEVFHKTGIPLSRLRNKVALRTPILIFGLAVNRQELYRRIDERVDRMVETGWLDEVRALISRGYSLSLPSMSGVGYRDLGLHLQGGMTLEEAVGRAKLATHRVARHQHAWFRLDDPRIHWFDVAELQWDAVTSEVRGVLGGTDSAVHKPLRGQETVEHA